MPRLILRFLPFLVSLGFCNSVSVKAPRFTFALPVAHVFGFSFLMGGIVYYSVPNSLNSSEFPLHALITVLINGLLSATSYDYRFVASYTGTISVENRAVAFKEFYYQGVHQAKTKGTFAAVVLLASSFWFERHYYATITRH